MQALNKKIILTSLVALLSGLPAIAAEAGSPDRSYNVNITLYCLVGLILIFLFVIGMLAYTLRQLSSVVGDKARQERNTNKMLPMVALALIAFPVSSFAQEIKVTASSITSISGIPTFDFYLLTAIICLELLVVFFLAIYILVLLKIIKGAPETIVEVKVAISKKSWFWDKFNAAATEDKEKEILLDHNYDGIQELDNSLPPWWKYGFYLTIIVAGIYLYRFHIAHDGQSQLEEFTTEMQQGEEDKAAYLANSASNVDESNVTQSSDAGVIASGKELFTKNCVACHMADGGGSVGPNLTDEYWLHGGDIKDVFKSIKYGWQDKGMKSWKDDLSPSQMQQIASFIKSLKGTHPAAPKAPQGDIYIEVAAASVKTDSAAKIK